MARFAMLYNIEDASKIAAWAATVDGLQTQDRQYAQRLWNGGMSGWATAPVVSVAYQQGDADTRGIVTFFSPGAERSRGNSLRTRAYLAATRTPRYLLVACFATSVGMKTCIYFLAE